MLFDFFFFKSCCVCVDDDVKEEEAAFPAQLMAKLDPSAGLMAFALKR